MRIWFTKTAATLCVLAAAGHAAAISVGTEVPTSGDNNPFPFMASLQDAALPFAQEPFGGPAGSNVCGGVMVGAGLVLTAPHCVTSDDLDNDTVVAKAPTRVWVGGPDRRQPGRSAGAKGLLILMTELDGLALVMLDQPRFAGEVIRVAGKDDIQAGAMGLALGWGMTRKARPGENAAALKSPVLKQLARQILSLPQTLAVPVGSPTDLEQYGSSADSRPLNRP